MSKDRLAEWQLLDLQLDLVEAEVRQHAHRFGVYEQLYGKPTLDELGAWKDRYERLKRWRAKP